uniref:Retrotransposon gag domain-containing protein n=1 Tax=Periophthalmus magnuspinnatus TaxID=409849 RepID=A0A3B4AFI1_9GOBI
MVLQVTIYKYLEFWLDKNLSRCLHYLPSFVQVSWLVSKRGSHVCTQQACLLPHPQMKRYYKNVAACTHILSPRSQSRSVLPPPSPSCPAPSFPVLHCPAPSCPVPFCPVLLHPAPPCPALRYLTFESRSHPEVVLGQHEQSIRTLLELNQTLSQQVAQLTHQVTTLLVNPPVAAGVPPCPPEPRGTDPEPYSGQPHLCRGFLFQCEFVFQQCPTHFNSGAAKICYMCGLLRGRALQWAEARLMNTPVDNLDFNEFITTFKLVFDHPHYQDNAASRLLTLNQGSRTVADYTIEFWTHMRLMDWTDSALRAVFVRGLNEHLKDELVSRDEPPDLRALITLANWIDNQLRARRRERRRSPAPPEPHAAPPPPEEPMQVDRTLVSAEEGQRRRRLTGACLYCGERGSVSDWNPSNAPSTPRDSMDAFWVSLPTLWNPSPL